MEVRLKQSFAGDLAGYDSPPAGRVVDVPEALAEALLSDGRATAVQPPAPEQQTITPAENKTATPAPEKRGTKGGK